MDNNSTKTASSQQTLPVTELSSEEIRNKIETALTQKNDVEVNKLYEQLSTSQTLGYVEYKQWGEALFGLEKYQDACNRLKAAAELLDNRRKSTGLSGLEQQHAATVYLAWGRSLAKLGDHKEASHKYSEANSLDQNNIIVLLKWGKSLIQLKDYERASTKYSTAKEKYPHDGRVYLGWGYLHLEKKQYQKADEKFELSIQKFEQEALENKTRNPKEISAYCSWGISLYYQQKYRQSLQKFEKSRDTYTQHIDNTSNQQKHSIPFPFPYINLASVFFELHNYPKAWENLDQSLLTYTKAVDDSRVITGRRFFIEFASVHKDFFNNLDKAKDCLENALELAPDDVSTLTALVELYVQLRNNVANHYGFLQISKEEEDIQWYSSQESHIQNTLTRNRICTYIPYGTYHSQAREWYRQAKAILVEKEKSAAAGKEKANFLNQLGDLSLAIEEIEDAQEYLTQALANCSESAKTHTQLGVAYTKKAQISDEDYTAAANHFQKSLRQKANDLNVWSNLAETYLKTKRLSKAETEYQRILLISPGHIDSLIGLGEVYVGMGENGTADFYEQAILHFNRGISLSEAKMGSKLLSAKELAEVMYLRAYAKTKLYDSKVIKDESLLDSARREFKQCLRFNPNNYKARKAHEKIREKQHGTAIHWISKWVGSSAIFLVSLIILGMSQYRFFISKPSSALSEEITSPITELSTETASREDISVLIETDTATNTETAETPEGQEENAAETTDAAAEDSAVNNSAAINTQSSTPEQSSTTEEGNGQGSLEQHAMFTFGLLTFMVIGLCLPQLLKLKMGVIELEKSSVDQINTSRRLNLDR